MKHHHIAIDGMRLHALVWEPQALPSRASVPTTLVLIHGFTGCAASWAALAPSFTAAGLRVIALDLPGHGESDAPAVAQRYAVTRTADDIVTALQQLGVAMRDVILLGYSLGGRIALATALGHQFRALILESASAGLATEAERAARRASDAALAARIERDGVRTFVDEWERLPLFASQQSLPAERRALLHAQRLRNNPAGLANSLRGAGTGAQPYLGTRLGELQLPTLLIAGALDAKYRAIAAQMAQQIPTVRTCVLPDAGHAVHVEQPEVFTAVVLDFMHDLAPFDSTTEEY